MPIEATIRGVGPWNNDRRDDLSKTRRARIVFGNRPRQLQFAVPESLRSFRLSNVGKLGKPAEAVRITPDFARAHHNLGSPEAANKEQPIWQIEVCHERTQSCPKCQYRFVPPESPLIVLSSHRILNIRRRPSAVGCSAVERNTRDIPD
jgi:hypothetical protein